METKTKNDFDEILKKDKYFKTRWSYFEEVIKLIKCAAPSSVLELGPYTFPLVKGSDVMDKRLYLPKIKYHHDATVFPWPIENKKYDLFVALQTWEHLGNKQKQAFKEAERISKTAILSFPYLWPGDNPTHSNINDKKISEWTLNYPFTKRKIIERDKRNIMIYFFEFISTRNQG